MTMTAPTTPRTGRIRSALRGRRVRPSPIPSAVGRVGVVFDRDSDPASWHRIIDTTAADWTHARGIELRASERDAVRAVAIRDVDTLLHTTRRGRPAWLRERDVAALTRSAAARTLGWVHPASVAVPCVIAVAVVAAVVVFVWTGWSESITETVWPQGTPVQKILDVGASGTNTIMTAAAIVLTVFLAATTAASWTRARRRRRIRTPFRAWLIETALYLAGGVCAAGVAVLAFRLGTVLVFTG